MSGPSIPISQFTHELKYRQDGETFYDAMVRVAGTLADNQYHRLALKDIFLNQRFLPAGRVQSATGAVRRVCSHNCFVEDIIPDSFDGIMNAAHSAGNTMRLGGGVGYDFSTLRPRYDRIKSLDSQSSGPISFMGIFDAVCQTIASAGHRRGAQMAVLRVDHPDIEEFVKAKHNNDKLTGFNISVGITDEFMEAVLVDGDFDLRFDGKVYKTIRATALWDKIMRSTWDWAEPGVLFIDRINEFNNLHYCETITATNPCAEQPLPPNGACLLGSFNLVKYLTVGTDYDRLTSVPFIDFNFDQFKKDILHVVRAMDNVIDDALYPNEKQEAEAKDKRRMGLGVTGVANALEIMGYDYASPEFLKQLECILRVLRDTAYAASIDLAIEKGPFPLFEAGGYLEGAFAKTLPDDLRSLIGEHGLRNSHLLSIAPTGTISLTADNVSSGIEPVFSYSYERPMGTPEGVKTFTVDDYAYREFGVKGRQSHEISATDHLLVLLTAQKYIDSAVSKTCNVGDDVSWDEFKEIYMKAWAGGAKGCTTFRASGKRFALLTTTEEEPEVKAEACYFDPETGSKTCE